MFKKEKWQEPMLKNDVKNVIISGILFAILGGILGGSLDYLFKNVIGFPITFGLIIISLLIGYGVYRAYGSFHILYPTLTILFMILGIFVAFFTLHLCINGISSFFTILGTGEFYLNFIKLPFSTFIVGIKYGNAGDIFMGIVNMVIYVLAFFGCYLIAKGRS